MSGDNNNQSLNHFYPIYDWINKDYLKEILKTMSTNSIINIQESKTTYATKRGENYCSALFRTKINFFVMTSSLPVCCNGNDESLDSLMKTISIIIKAKLYDPHSSVDRTDYMDYMFLRESHTYKIILKAFVDVIGHSTVFAPRLLYLDDRAIVLEDLQIRGYHIKDIKKRLNYNECRMVIKKIAQFHAIGAIIYSRDQKLFENHHQGNVTEKFNAYHLIFKNGITSCIRMAKKTLSLQKYVTKLELFAEQIITKMINVYSTDLNDNRSFKTLNHGDLWVNNIMFSDDENDVLFVDFQEGFFGSPGIDLNYFIYTSCNQETIMQYFDELICEYHGTLAMTLGQFNFTGFIPTLQDIQNEINQKADYALSTLLCISPLLSIDNLEYADTEMVVSHDEKYVKMREIVFSDETYQKNLILNLPKFIENGHL